MNIKTVLTVIVSLALVQLLGCSKSGEIFRIGGPMQHEKNAAEEAAVVSNAKKKVHYTKHKFSTKVNLNVNRAFLLIKKEFNYYTEAEFRATFPNSGIANMAMRSKEIEYSHVPNAYYRMQREIADPGHENNIMKAKGSGYKYHRITTTIEAVNENTSEIFVEFKTTKTGLSLKKYLHHLDGRFQRAVNKSFVL